jgi:hypothetical protein
MNLESLSIKQVTEIERLTKELLLAMRKAKLQDTPVTEALRVMEQELGEIRRTRFDAANPEYHSY